MSIRNFLLCTAIGVLSSGWALGDCPVGDLNNDCRVDFEDIQQLAQWWLVDSCQAPDCEADLDGIPGVDGADYAKLAENWLQRGTLTLAINEFMARNTHTLRDPDDPGGSFDDWIEIYNYGAEAIDIGGFYISDNANTLTGHRIPSNAPAVTTIAAGGYLLIWADNDTGEGPLHVSFALSGDGEDVALFDADHRLIDSVTFGPQSQDISYGRLPNGTGSWRLFTSPTPGSANLGDPVQVRINEIMYHPGHPEETPENLGLEYIELYNAGTTAVDVSNWRITDGVDYTIPARAPLGSGQYLVIAADVNEFSRVYPGVTHVVGGWVGHLSNNGERIELSDASGIIIDRVRYADEGDWAVRELGPVERGHRGWQWSNAHDGGGQSLELMNVAISNDYGGNWSASNIEDPNAPGGTPGGTNSVWTSNIAPLILDVEHWPVIPGPNDAVTVTARVIDESVPTAVRLHYRVDRSVYSGDESIYPHYEPNDYNDVAMYDDGLHGDGQVGDGLYGAEIPAYPDGLIMEFFVEARDETANVRTWPAASYIDETLEQVTNALYQVDADYDPTTWFAEDLPVHYIIMTEMERGRLQDIVQNDSNIYGPDSQMNATFISTDGTDVNIRYTVGVRNRGHGSRDYWPNNYRVNFNSDHDWKGVRAINLNVRYSYIQLAGSVLSQLAGLPTAKATAVRVITNGRDMALTGNVMYGAYVQLEVINGDFAENHFPDDGEGNVYKCMRDFGPADFGYRGTDPDSYRNSYFKQSNESADDWANLIEVCRVVGTASDEEYVQEIERVLNTDNWLLYFVLNAFMDNNETSLANGYGDDYYTYSGLMDPRFILIPHDWDSILGYQGSSITSSILRARGLATIDRFLTHPEFMPRYYGRMREVMDSLFSDTQSPGIIRNMMKGFVPESTINQVISYISRRRTHITSLIPSELTAQTPLSEVSGYDYTNVNTAELSGTADAVATRSVLVNGHLADWDPITAGWQITEQTSGNTVDLVPRGSIWKYFDQYTDLGPDWYVDVNDSTWPEGNADIGYGDNQNTIVGYIDTDPNTSEIERNMTTYLTHHFQVADASRYAFLSLLIRRDDGAVLYLNGVELARSNMPEGEIGYDTPAFSNVYGTPETTFYGGNAFSGDEDFTVLDASALVDGENVLAVELHNILPTSPDICLDLELTALEAGEPILYLQPGINRMMVQAFDGPSGTGTETQRTYKDVWYDDGDAAVLSGTLSSDRILDASSGPWIITGTVTVPSGYTLTIEPGCTVYFGNGAQLVVNGRLTAVGSPYQHIRLTGEPGSGDVGSGILLQSTESNTLSYVDIDYPAVVPNALLRCENARAILDHVEFAGDMTYSIQSFGSSLVVRGCNFTGGFGPVVSVLGTLATNPSMVFEDNTFGPVTETEQDVVVFSGQGMGVRPVFRDNVFLGGGDDGLNLSGSGAHIEGNTFAGFSRNYDPANGRSFAIVCDSDGTATPSYMVAGNIFSGCDNAVLSQGYSWLDFQNNVVADCPGTGVSFNEPLETTAPGIGGRVTGTIFHNSPSALSDFFVDHVQWGTTLIEMDHCIVPEIWQGLGEGNIYADPLFVDANNGDYHLTDDSPGIGAGALGVDMGAYAASGAAVGGEPDGTTYRTTATLTVGGPGITSYQYCINDPNGFWSAETSVDAPIELFGLNGSYTVYVRGRDSAGQWQEGVTASHTWTVDSSSSKLVINEVLAHTHGNDPDVIELYYDGPVPLNLTGYSLSDDSGDPRKFVISASTVGEPSLNPGGYMVLFGDATVQMDYLGFALTAEGEALYLYNPAGELVDSVEFGLQINDYSIGRIGYGGQWELCVPTRGEANVRAALGDPRELKINEWLADERILFADDFIELYNPCPAPVDLSGLYLTDNFVAQPAKHRIAPLSFIPPEGYAVLLADGSDNPGSMNFNLSADGELIALLDENLGFIDKVIFGPQTTDISQGRVPNGGDSYEFFALPTPGVANYGMDLQTTSTVLMPENADKRVLVPTENISDTWFSDLSFDDSAWTACVGEPGGIGYETGSGYEDYLTCDLTAEMYDINKTCYIRIPFNVNVDPGSFDTLQLRIRYDDGFIAYLNGQEISRRNFTGDPNWDSEADTSHSDTLAILFEDIDVTGYRSILHSGENLLAIHGMNISLTSTDMLISAELTGTSVVPGTQYPFAEDVKVLAGLRVTEIMYHAPGGSQYDYIELTNISDENIDIAGVRFLEGIVFEFPQLELEPGDYVVLAADPVAFANVYGPVGNVVGPYTGGLSNGGEELVLILRWPLDAAIMRFSYADTWYPTTDGGGQSLTIIDPTAHPLTWNDPESWKAATRSPGGP